MPFSLKNCLKFKKKKNRKNSNIKDVVKPVRDIIDQVTTNEIWPDCRESVSTVSDHGNEELDARVCNEIRTNVSGENNSTPALEREKPVTQASVTVIQDENEIVEMVNRSKSGASQIENTEYVDNKSDESVEMLKKEQHDGPQSEDKIAAKSESISETSEYCGPVFSLYSKLSNTSAEYSTVESSEIKEEIGPHQEKSCGKDLIPEGRSKDAEGNSIELLVGFSEEKACKDHDFEFTEKTSESSDVEDSESIKLAKNEMAKIIAGVTVRSNVFEKIEELQRLLCTINEKRHKQMEEFGQKTQQMKDAEISGVSTDELSVVNNTDCDENENALDSSMNEGIRSDFSDGGFEGVSKLLTCDNLSKSHVTNIGKSEIFFSGDYPFEKLTGKENESKECKTTAEGTAHQFITPDYKVVENIGDKNKESLLFPKTDKSSCRLADFGESGIGEKMVSNTTELSKDIKETTKTFLRQSCTGDMNYENSLDYKHELLDVNLKMHVGENCFKTGIVKTRDSFSKKFHNGEKQLSESLRFEVVENNSEKLDTETDLQADTSTNKWGEYGANCNGEANKDESKYHVGDEINRSNIENKVNGKSLAFDSYMSNAKPKDSLSINLLDRNNEDHESRDYIKKEIVNGDVENELDLQNGNKNDSKGNETHDAGMSVIENIEGPHSDANIGIASEFEKKDSDSAHLKEMLRQIMEKNIINDAGGTSDESKAHFYSDKCNELVIDQEVENSEIEDSTHLENEINTEEFTDASDSRTNLTCYGFELNVGEQSSENALSQSSINNFSTNDNMCACSTVIDDFIQRYRDDFKRLDNAFQHPKNEKSRIIETSSTQNIAEDLKNLCFPMNIHLSEKMLEKKEVAKENPLSLLFSDTELDKNTMRHSNESLHEISSQASEHGQKEIYNTEEFKCLILETCCESINIPLKDCLLNENLKNKKNQKSIFREACFVSNPTLDIQISEECSSPSLLIEKESEIIKEKPRSENTAMFADGDVWDKDRTVSRQSIEPHDGAYLASEKKCERGPVLTSPHHASHNQPSITINIHPTHTCKFGKSKKLFTSRRRDGQISAKNTPMYHQTKHDTDISPNFTGGIPEDVLDEIEFRRKESLYTFNRMKKAALVDMKPTARVIPVLRSRSYSSKMKRPPVLKTSPRDIEHSFEGPTSSYGHSVKNKIINDNKSELNENTTRHQKEFLHEISSQASERMTPDRKRILDVSREIRSRWYPVRIDGKTCVINARNQKNPFVTALQTRNKKNRPKEKQSGKNIPVKGEFKIHSPEKIECLPPTKAKHQSKPEGRKLQQDYQKIKFDHAFGRYASRGRLDSNSISYKRSREWLRDAGIVGKILTDDEANDAFKCTSGMKLTMSKEDYRQFIRKLARLKRLNYDELYDKLCSVVAKHAVREVM